MRKLANSISLKYQIHIYRIEITILCIQRSYYYAITLACTRVTAVTDMYNVHVQNQNCN